MALVSDTAASTLTVELLKVTCRRVAESCARRRRRRHGDDSSSSSSSSSDSGSRRHRHDDDRDDDGDDAALTPLQLRQQALEQRGVLVGLRLSERLLCRAPVFARGSALDAARFVAYTLWRAMYGKKMDVVKHIGNVYDLVDKDLHWLQGFPRATEHTTTTTTADTTSSHAAAAANTTAAATTTTCVRRADDADDNNNNNNNADAAAVTRNDVLVYLVSIVKAAVYTLVGDALDVVVEASNASGNEVHLVLDFRA